MNTDEKQLLSEQQADKNRGKFAKISTKKTDCRMKDWVFSITSEIGHYLGLPEILSG